MSGTQQKTFATVCSGIGAPEVAASRIGWRCLFGSEIEPFPNAVRAHHFPDVPNYGDMTKYHEWPESNPDVLVAGTPCQAFSVAGLRKGLADPRGNLTLTFLGIVERYAPRWVLWENVPGVLSEDTGAFGSFLRGLAELGYGFAYRILDAQYFGVAQRRRRVFVVAHSGGEWQRAAAVLFERESLCGNPPPSRETREGIAPTISARTKGGGGLGTDADCDGAVIPIQEIGKRQSGTPQNGVGHGDPGDPMFTLQSAAVHGVCTFAQNSRDEVRIVGGNISGAISAEPGMKQQTYVAIGFNGDETPKSGIEVTPTMRRDQGGEGFCVAHVLKGEGFDASEDGTGRGVPLVPEICSSVTSKWAKSSGGSSGGPSGHECQNLVAFPQRLSATQCASAENISPSLQSQNPTAVAFNPSFARGGKSSGSPADICHTLSHSPKQGDTSPHCVSGMAVRRLTPRECERLQGFPDDFTAVQFRGKPAADGPRYKALGNSMAVPVIEWILRRMDLVDELVPLKKEIDNL